MKKLLTYVYICCVIFACGLLFSACKQNNDPGKPISVDLMKIEYHIDDNGDYEYKLTWDSFKSNYKYKVKYGNEEKIVENKFVVLNDFEPNVIHRIEVSSIDADTGVESDPEYIEFRGTRLDSPLNFRVYGDTNSLGWQSVSGSNAYRLIFEELDLDQQTSQPIKTGNVKNIITNGTQIGIPKLREIYEENDLDLLQNVTVQSLPYKWSQYFEKSTSGIVEFVYPSEIDQSVNLYASQVSNPTNLRWDTQDPEKLKLKWDIASSGFSYIIHDGRGYHPVTDVDATEYEITDLSIMREGEYEAVVEINCETFNHIVDKTYSFYLKQEAQTIKYSIRDKVLDTPQNIRIEGNNIVWDAVENANGYIIRFEREQDGNYLEPNSSMLIKSTSIALETFFDKDGIYANRFANQSGNYTIEIQAYAFGAEIVDVENSVAIIDNFQDSEWGTSAEKIKLEAIQPMENVEVDCTDNDITVTWTSNPQVDKYYIYFKRLDGTGVGHYCASNITQYSTNIGDILDYDYVEVIALVDFEMTVENNIVTILIPSSDIVELQA